MKDSLKIVMRVYIQKPRTTTGWTGPVNQPDPFKPSNIGEGAKYCREMMVKVVEMGLPIADEAVFTHNAKGFIELLSWVAIGARSTEDQEHRVFASSLDCAVGMKNPTSGSIEIGVNSVVAAQYPHMAVLTVRSGRAATRTRTSSFVAVLGPTTRHSIEEAIGYAEAQHQNPSIILDTSHDNTHQRVKHGESARSREWISSSRAGAYEDGEGIYVRELLKAVQKVDKDAGEIGQRGLDYGPVSGWSRRRSFGTRGFKKKSLLPL